MAVDILLGLQWGDEGKGKIVDVLAPKYEIVARFQGGPNAGHTLEFDGNKHVLHQIPSGIFHDNIINIIGNGVVIDPIIFRKEIEALAKYNIDFGRNLFISKRAHLILPTHRLLDLASEQNKGTSKIGSTLKGISPTYQDKIGRQGLRIGDILLPNFKERYHEMVQKHFSILKYYAFNIDEDIKKIQEFAKYDFKFETIENTYFEAIEYVKQFNLADTDYLINEEIYKGKSVLAEGAQGALLDIDFGSYPYVTSSNTTASGACSGLGIAPNKINNVFGIFKAYSTRVGGGPFPTELNDDTGEKIRQIGREFGSTTGRPRRCGWLDMPALKYSCMINGVTQLMMMKADVLNDFEQIKVAAGYHTGTGKPSNKLTFDILQQAVVPSYIDIKGWNKALSGIKSYEDLPSELKAYVQYIENELDIPMSIISLGPDRSETVFKM
ncbi:MAG: adenylosuccinate synthase [Cytophagales bacterium]|nr:adenylosuccinate synthase [Cytophagales bacterium]